MVVNNVALEAVAVSKEQYPSGGLPEIAFVGRSNVGKSSLINAMVYRKAIARTSSAPGKTRTINFYNVEGSVYFVDLPGYGYAKTSKAESAKWGKMIEQYLYNREALKCVVQLIDIRHEPSAQDRQMNEWLRYYKDDTVIAATKADKLGKQQVQRHLGVIRKSLGLGDGLIIPFSSETKQGRDELWDKIYELMFPQKKIGFLKGQFKIPDDFDRMCETEILEMFEGK